MVDDLFVEKNQKENKNMLKKPLIIVCDEKLMVYANYLIALIGQNDDADDGEIVGTKDDTVSATIFTPKHYKDTLPTITSNTHILFIGSFKEAKEQGENVKFYFNKYGMKYGWLGKRAVMYVEDNMLKKDEYENFIKFSKEYQKEFEATTVNFAKGFPNAVKMMGVFLPIAYPLAIFPEAMYGLMFVRKAHKKIKDQQYRCLTMALYLDGLQKFLEG
jgi:hypothetical protein